jgi:hypothetical protein
VIRSLVTAAALVLLLFGTIWGEDDVLPFGPFKMYAGTARIDDPVPTMQFEAETENGEVLDLRSLQFGLRPAEVEGQLERVRTDPSLLEDMVAAYERLNPDADRLVAFRVMHGTYHLENERPVDYVEEVLAEWRR